MDRPCGLQLAALPEREGPRPRGKRRRLDRSVSRAVRVPPEKLNIGTAFYGYEFDEAPKLWGGCGCGAGTTSRDYGTYIKQRVNHLGWEAHVDKIAKAPFLLRPGQSGFLTYDDARSTKQKVNYALGERGLGGVFMSEISGDFDGQTQDLLSAMSKAFGRYRR